MRIFASIFLMITGIPVIAQIQNPISVSSSIEMIGQDTAIINFDVEIAQGWHVYSTNMPKGGPIEAFIKIDTIAGSRLDSVLTVSGKEVESYDNVFNMVVRYFENRATFSQRIIISNPDFYIEGVFTYGACDNKSCLPPQRVEFEYSGSEKSVLNSQHDAELWMIEGYDETLWNPVFKQIRFFDNVAPEMKRGWTGLLIAGFLGGLLALLTPCVWPIIPMTVSFFLKRSNNRRMGVRNAILYGCSIVVIYVTVGLAVTLIFGASALNALSTHAIPNLIFFLLLIIFALSFFGLFDITLPSNWSTGIDRKAGLSSGIWGIFLMALTLTVVSFSCTGPIIGFLLVEAATNSGLMAPAIGMFGFAIALALPFTLFALFPQWLDSIPKSGGWMEKVKVTLGFIELGFALKFFSVADMAYGWGLLPRELFLFLWILLSLLCGLYLFNIFRFNKKSEKSRITVWSVIPALACFSFAIYLIPGLKGAPLKAISAFTPPMSATIFSENFDYLEPDFVDFEEGMRFSAKVGKPAIVNFTGYGCVNCRKMEESVWAHNRVRQILENDFVVITLHVDDKTPLENILKLNENGTYTRLRTIGDKWSFLQRHKFGANAQPFYIILDNNANPLGGSYSFNTDVELYLAFLQRGMAAYNNNKFSN
ncbi:MAG TPA: cytochrome c biogenesis protein CcdA [Bacteroidaceae bacterium]|nr:cytochrome c biogenesis protein CcdA [Bacteroidaceae bacterium]